MKKISKISMCIAVLGLLFFCSMASRPKDETRRENAGHPVVGLVETLSESAWKDKLYTSVKAEAAKNNIQVITIKTGRTLEEQMQAVRTLISYQVSSIVLDPLVTNGWENIMKEAKEAGIPIILIGQKINCSDDVKSNLTYVGSDNVKEGENAAQFIRDYYMNGKTNIKIMEIHGTVGSSITAERSRGINNILTKDKRYDIYYVVSCDGMRSKAKEMTKIFLGNQRKPDVLISFSDSMTMGVLDAMRANHLTPGKDILVVSFDGEREAVEALKKGQIGCIVESNPNVGKKVIEVVKHPTNIYGGMREYLMEEAVFTQENVKEVKERTY